MWTKIVGGFKENSIKIFAIKEILAN